jgi:hypothetical protein
MQLNKLHSLVHRRCPMGEQHEKAYGEGKADAEAGRSNPNERGPIETGALAASGIGLILDAVLPGGDPKVQASYEAGREDAEDDD